MFWTQAQGDAVTNNLWGSVTTFAQFGTAVQSGLIGPHGYGLARCEAKMTAQLLRVELDKKSPVYMSRSQKHALGVAKQDHETFMKPTHRAQLPLHV